MQIEKELEKCTFSPRIAKKNNLKEKNSILRKKLIENIVKLQQSSNIKVTMLNKALERKTKNTQRRRKLAQQQQTTKNTP